jgi:hypothetical protein
VLWFGQTPLAHAVSGMQRWQDLTVLVILGAIAGGLYSAIVLVMLGRDWLARFRSPAPR